MYAFKPKRRVKYPRRQRSFPTPQPKKHKPNPHQKRRKDGKQQRQPRNMREYHDQIWALRATGGILGGIRHVLWWLLHNCVAHPMLGMVPGAPTVRFHDWSSDRLNLRKVPYVSPMPQVERRWSWLLHNCVVHPLMGIAPLFYVFDWHDDTASDMHVKGWA